MTTSVQVLIEGEGVDPAAAEEALKKAGLEVQRVQTRGVAEALKWVLKFTGDAAKAGDVLVEQATKQLAGATIKIQSGDRIIEVSNANRSQLMEILDKAQEIVDNPEAR